MSTKTKSPKPLTQVHLPIGKALDGTKITLNLARSPHVLITGESASDHAVQIGRGLVGRLHNAGHRHVTLPQASPKLLIQALELHASRFSQSPQADAPLPDPLFIFIPNYDAVVDPRFTAGEKEKLAEVTKLHGVVGRILRTNWFTNAQVILTTRGIGAPLWYQGFRDIGNFDAQITLGDACGGMLTTRSGGPRSYDPRIIRHEVLATVDV